MASSAFGIFISQFYNGLRSSGFWLKCNRYSCTMPNMKGCMVLPENSSTNSFSFPSLEELPNLHLKVCFIWSFEDHQMALEVNLLHVPCFSVILKASILILFALPVQALMASETESCFPKTLGFEGNILKKKDLSSVIWCWMVILWSILTCLTQFFFLGDVVVLNGCFCAF